MMRNIFASFLIGTTLKGINSLTELWAALTGIQEIQSTLVISKLKGPSATLRDIRISRYQIFRIEENTNRTTKFHK